MTLTPGQQWIYHAPKNLEQTRMVIGAIATCGQQGRVICCSIITNEPMSPDVTVPFLPMTEAAFLESVIKPDGMGNPADGFAATLENWKSDPRGLSVFTVPYKGDLKRLIKDQVEAVSAQNAA